jgi:hypothetical protein
LITHYHRLWNDEERKVIYMLIDELLLGEYGGGGGGNGGRLGGLKVEFRRIVGLLRCFVVYS